MADDTEGRSPPDLDERLDEDEPARLQPDWPPELAAPLKPFAGAEPPAPAWFAEALAQPPDRRLIQVAGANIERLAWGEVGNPGLMLVHGNSAHADWWSYIAPFLAQGRRVAAISLSGMGGSDWRDRYDFPTYAEEIFAVAKDAGLYEAETKPVFVGHSFGGAQVFYSAALHPERMAGVILVDSSLGALGTEAQRAEWARVAAIAGRPHPGPIQRTRPNRVYPALEEALARFRLSPPQVPGNLFAADFIARRSLRPAPLPDAPGTGWTWKFDPFLWRKLERTELASLPKDRLPPLVDIIADRSALVPLRQAGEISLYVPPGTPSIVIPNSEHHIMVDQPLALVAALNAVLAVWPA
ncbi:MAG: alpha/beta hydrolase [Caulobacteraceae bacterium]|nr:alpha/beta hydrolase [Caulobacteraceae bacterium]